MRCDGSTLFLVVGNSGSGKDSVMALASRLCPGLHVMTRFITRPYHDSEDFVSVSEEEFERLFNENYFCVSWKSYGLSYGVPAELDGFLSDRVPVLVNISRTAIDYFRSSYPGAKVVFISANLDAIRKRIGERGREEFGSEEMLRRLKRAEHNLGCDYADFTIDNSGELEKSASELCRFINESSCT